MRRGTWSTLRRVGRASKKNAVELHLDGDEAFRSLWRAIRAARRRVWVEIYTLRDDAVGRHTLALLERAVRRGCEVLVLYDAVGSFELPGAVLEPLISAGGRVAAFNPPLAPTGEPPFARDHRKLVIADGRAFLGGLNLTRDYAGTRLGTGRFQDVLIAVEGPAVESLAAFYRQTARGLDPGAGHASDRVAATGPHEVVVLASDRRRHVRTIQEALRLALRRAERSALLVSPYFVPPPALARSMIVAARRGIDVRVVTAGETDSRLSRAAGRHVYDKFLRAGVRVFELDEETLHAKVAVIDGGIVFVGSYNLDRWSGYRNLELMLAVRAPALGARLTREFAEATGAREVHSEDERRRGIVERAGQWASFQLLRI